MAAALPGQGHGVNAWQSNSPPAHVGSEVTGLTRLHRVQRPVDTIYLADNESGYWRHILTSLGSTGSMQRNEVWSPNQLCFAAGGRMLNADQRVAAARHGQGLALLYYTGHSATKRS